MKRVVLAVLMVAGVGVAWLIHETAKIGVGYSSKQLCSGVHVAGLPPEFIIERDIQPRLASVSWLAHWLQTDVGDYGASATILTASAISSYYPGYGCTLHGADMTLPVVADMPPIATPVVDNAALSTIIDRAFEEPDDGGRNTLAFAVIHRGELIVERYADPVNNATRMQSWSMNKSLMASFIGLQVARGAMSLDDSVVARLRSLDAPDDILANLSPDLTVRHLLSMTSGLDFDERYVPGDDVSKMLYGDGPMWQVPARQPQKADPGSVFDYSSGDTNLVSYLWQQSLKGEDYRVWIERELSTPLGLSAPILEPDLSGTQIGASFAYLTARDWARVGQWWLDAYHARDDRLSQAWQRLAVTPGSAIGGDIYGLGFWLNTRQENFPGLPENVFRAGGNSGQFVVVIPDDELVVVRLGLTLDESKVQLGPVLVELVAALRRGNVSIPTTTTATTTAP
jgi:CubicO group peptidase (beta-lactamase class C family)